MAERKAEAEAKQKEAREREAENSFEKVARKWWDWRATGKSQRHADYVLRRLEADVFPSFGHKFIAAVTAADIRNPCCWVVAIGEFDCSAIWRQCRSRRFREAGYTLKWFSPRRDDGRDGSMSAQPCYRQLNQTKTAGLLTTGARGLATQPVMP